MKKKRVIKMSEMQSISEHTRKSPIFDESKIFDKSKHKTEIKIVKREGYTELYDERKVYGSCFFACRNAHLSQQEAEQICNKVCIAVTRYVNKKKVVSSNDIFRILVGELKKHNEDAAFLYETHRDIS